MVFREVYESQDFRRLCKHAERDHETKKLDVLIERLNRQLAEQGRKSVPAKPPVAVLNTTAASRTIGRFPVFET
jgi:hypothetical protein